MGKLGLHRFGTRFTRLGRLCAYLLRDPRLLGLRRIPGLLTILEGYLLNSLARRVVEGDHVVEIGSYKGKSTRFLLAALVRKKESKLFAVDTWKQKIIDQRETPYDEFRKNTREFRTRLVTVNGESTSASVLSEIRKIEPIGMIFVDGDHSYENVRQEISDYLPLLKEDGFICFHDYTNPCGVKQAVDEAEALGILSIVIIVDSTCVAKKQPASQGLD
jgi:predicted O-methyltransferase YrrM